MTDQLLARIEKLERQNKRMRVIMTGLCLCLGALLTMGQMLPKKTENRHGTDRSAGNCIE